MPQNTPISELPYPTATEPPDGPGAIYSLATALDPIVQPAYNAALGIALNNTSLNTVFGAGIYSGINCFFTPEGSLDKFVLQVIPFDSANATQTCFLFADTSMWVRFALGGTWGTWKRVTLT